MRPIALLIVHPDPVFRRTLTRALEADDRRVLATGDPKEALAHADTEAPDLLLSSTSIDGKPGGHALEFVGVLRQRARGGDLILLIDGPVGKVGSYLFVQARRWGVMNVIQPPHRLSQVQEAVREALELRRMRRRGLVAAPHAGESPLVGKSSAMKGLRQLIANAAAHDHLVTLLLGESGTGKELVAREIHRTSPRSDHPFVAVRLGSLQPTLAASELFGHAKGAFTGASRDRAGAFGRAKNGTVFLDEIGDLPQELQPRLLAVLHEREFRALGSDVVQPRRARVVAATNRDLALGVSEGWFRKDLFHRLNVLVGRLPPLRDRLDDLELLAAHLLARVHQVSDWPHPPVLTREALDRLRAHPWPGNVRELENCLQRALVRSRAGVIRVRDIELAPPVTGSREVGLESWSASGDGGGHRTPSPPTASLALRDADGSLLSLVDATRQHIEAALRDCKGNVAAAARALGIPRTTLASKMKSLGLERPPSQIGHGEARHPDGPPHPASSSYPTAIHRPTATHPEQRGGT